MFNSVYKIMDSNLKMGLTFSGCSVIVFFIEYIVILFFLFFCKSEHYFNVRSFLM